MKLSSELGQLTALEDLRVERNRIFGMPTQIGQLTRLTTFNASLNSFEFALPSEIGLLTALTMLDLRSAGLAGPIPNEFGNLTSLTSALLDGNSFCSDLPDSLANLAVGVLSISSSFVSLSNANPTVCAVLSSCESTMISPFDCGVCSLTSKSVVCHVSPPSNPQGLSVTSSADGDSQPGFIKAFLTIVLPEAVPEVDGYRVYALPPSGESELVGVVLATAVSPLLFESPQLTQGTVLMITAFNSFGEASEYVELVLVDDQQGPLSIPGEVTQEEDVDTKTYSITARIRFDLPDQIVATTGFNVYVVVSDSGTVLGRVKLASVNVDDLSENSKTAFVDVHVSSALFGVDDQLMALVDLAWEVTAFNQFFESEASVGVVDDNTGLNSAFRTCVATIAAAAVGCAFVVALLSSLVPAPAAPPLIKALRTLDGQQNQQPTTFRLSPLTMLTFVQAIALTGSMQSSGVPIVYRSFAQGMAWSTGHFGLLDLLNIHVANIDSVGHGVSIEAVIASLASTPATMFRQTIATTLMTAALLLIAALIRQYIARRQQKRRVTRTVALLGCCAFCCSALQYGLIAWSLATLISRESIPDSVGAGFALCAVICVPVASVMVLKSILTMRKLGGSVSSTSLISPERLRMLLAWLSPVRPGYEWYLVLCFWSRILAASLVGCFMSHKLAEVQLIVLLVMSAASLALLVLVRPHQGGALAPDFILDSVSMSLVTITSLLSLTVPGVYGWGIALVVVYSLVLGVTFLMGLIPLGQTALSLYRSGEVMDYETYYTTNLPTRRLDDSPTAGPHLKVRVVPFHNAQPGSRIAVVKGPISLHPLE